jgi:hypothetical protein
MFFLLSVNGVVLYLFTEHKPCQKGNGVDFRLWRVFFEDKGAYTGKTVSIWINAK